MAKSAIDKLYLEDLSVGQRFTTGTLTLTEAEIKAFAGRYDPQPFHLDDAAAAKTLFGGLAASGWHTAAITMRLLVDGGYRLKSVTPVDQFRHSAHVEIVARLER